MSTEVDLVADAVLYEGYLLYPYRATSTRNRTRWTFGGLFPQSWGSSEPTQAQAECLLNNAHAATLRVRVRFLHLIDREGWQEAAPREVSFDAPLGELLQQERRVGFSFGPGRDEQGGVVRTHELVQGEVTASAVLEELGGKVPRPRPFADCLIKLSLRIANLTPLANPSALSRDEAQRHALASTQAILHADAGEFISLMGPPEEHRAAALACRNVGLWPVLAGPEGTADTMLASPIILYDHPRVTPESPGDLFDATEIDELLCLRILTLTDEEKEQVRQTDERARKLLERTEALGGDQLLNLHGAVRGLRRLPPGGQTVNLESLDGPRPPLQRVRRGHLVLSRGDRVRLTPSRSADSMDLFLADQVARIESIEEDFEGRIHLAVTLEEDPGRDLGAAGMPGHRFFFRPEEVEPLPPTEVEE